MEEKKRRFGVNYLGWTTHAKRRPHQHFCILSSRKENIALHLLRALFVLDSMLRLGLYECTRNKPWSRSELGKEAVYLLQAEHMAEEKTLWKGST